MCRSLYMFIILFVILCTQPRLAKSLATASALSLSKCVFQMKCFMFLSVTSRSVQHIRATCHGRRYVLTINCRMTYLIIPPEFAIVNPHLLRELVDRKMWSNDIKQSIIAANGSVQHLQLPDDIKAMYVPFNFTPTHLIFILFICTLDTRLPGRSSSVRLSIWLRTGEE